MNEQTLVEQALHLPRREARRWRHTPLEQEDLVADGNLALAKAAKRYDPSYGVPFPAFATPYVRGAIADTVRTRARRNTLGDGRLRGRRRVPRPRRTVARDDQAYEPAGPGPTPHDTVENLDRLRVARDDPRARAHRADPDGRRRRHRRRRREGSRRQPRPRLHARAQRLDPGHGGARHDQPARRGAAKGSRSPTARPRSSPPPPRGDRCADRRAPVPLVRDRQGIPEAHHREARRAERDPRRRPRAPARGCFRSRTQHPANRWP